MVVAPVVRSIALALLLGSCRERPTPPRNGEVSVPSASVVPLAATTSSVDAAPPPWATERAHESVTVAFERLDSDWFSFGLADVHLTIEDVHATRDLAKTLVAPDAVFATNAGFFDEDDAPLGLSVSTGKKLSAFGPKLSGGVLEITAGSATLFETESYDKTRTPDFAVQCRPRLVVASQPNVRSDDKKRAERTAVCLRENGKQLSFVILKNDTRGPSLFAVGKYLAERGCHEALALDGGPSTGAVYAGPNGREEIPLRGPIRQAIVVARRHGLR